MAKNVVTDSKNYIFSNAAGARDTIEKAIVLRIKENGISNKISQRTMRGSLLFGGKNKCLIIKGDSTFDVIISCIPIGNFLYVSLYLNQKNGVFTNLIRKNKEDDVFKFQVQNGIYVALQACCDEAFSMLELK